MKVTIDNISNFMKRKQIFMITDESRRSPAVLRSRRSRRSPAVRRSPAARGSYSRRSSAARSLDHLLLYPSLRLCHSLPCSARPGVGFCRNLVSCCSYGKAAEGFWRHMTDGKIYSCCNRLDRSNASRLLYAVPRDRNRPIRQEVLVSRVESRRRGLTLSGSLKES
jgi:hypothetical protein